jgi:hypothetical protein
MVTDGSRGAHSEVFDVDGGRVLEVRETTADDAERLGELFAGLSREDITLRFFTSFTPKADWCRSWAAVGERGGFGVIALVRGDEVEVVGEAGYAMRADGDGDFGLTVAAPWRGWLGAYLLDVIVRHAADHRVANLQAEVLVDNGPMLRLLRHRGAVVYEHAGGTIRMTISTSGHVASWPPNDDRPHVLVEVGGGRWHGENLARAAGMSTVFCSGPKRRTRHGCPVLHGGNCPLADGADAIIVLLDPHDQDTTDLIDAHRQQHPATPILVRSRTDTTPDGCIECGPTARDTLDRVRSELDLEPE